MPWSNSGPGRDPGPWGSGSGRGNGDDRFSRGRPGRGGRPPDLEELIARLQALIRNFLPGGSGSNRGLALLVIAVLAIWLVSGFYRVQPDEQGVVLRFGAFSRTTLPGLNYHLPWPVESVLRPAVTRINRIEIGYRSGTEDSRGTGAGQAPRAMAAESLMLTGDENIIDIDFAVFWRIRDAGAFLFNTREPSATIKSVAESVMREVIGRTPIQPALTELRAQIETQVFQQTQKILDSYGAGVEITQVQLQKVDPPAAVIESFRDVQRANTDAERMRNEAEAYHNDIVPRARGDAARITAEAEGARQASIAEATGQTQRFQSVLTAYQSAKEITLRRMYLDTMQDILTRSSTIVVDESIKGLVPFLPLLPSGGHTGTAETAMGPGGTRGPAR
ncbi:MAG: FtsH protease activity modulator HflK [Acetobacteraceae bacterium]|nr:FtsH protease activity modulator HflK [Acetobacteraceae bacterium]